MTELEELKNTMQAPPDFEPVPLDLGAVMAAGGRRRRRRRFAVGAASAAAVTAVLVGGSQLMSLGGPPNVAGVAATPLPSAAPSGGVPSGRMPSGVPSGLNSSAPGILGKVVDTGRWADGRQWILYVETVNPDKLDFNLTLALGRTKTGYINDFTVEIIGRDDAGHGRMSPGFHAVTAGTVRNGRTTPTFGYYRGDAARITARDTGTGKTVEAHRTAWSGFGADEKAQIFWFDFKPDAAPAHLTGLTAYDQAGNKLPPGNNAVTG
jgi:hypothetical protein